MGNPKGLVHVGGQRMTRAQRRAPTPSACRSCSTSHERGRTPDELWEEAIARPAHAWSSARARPPGATSCAEYDEYSLYEFLRAQGWSRGRDRVLRGLNFLESDMHNSFVEVLREDLGGAYVDMQEIAGGMDALPNAFYAELQDEVRFGAEVFAIDQDARRRHGALQDRGRPVLGARGLRDLHRAVLGAAHDRGPRRRSPAASSGRSGSSTTTPRPRSCSRSASGSGRPTTASSAAGPSPTCRSGA